MTFKEDLNNNNKNPNEINSKPHKNKKKAKQHNNKKLNENEINLELLSLNIKRKNSLSLLESDSSVKSGSEMFNITKNSINNKSQDEHSSMSEKASLKSSTSTKSILKKKLADKEVRQYEPFIPKHQMSKAKGLCNKFTQRHLKIVNQKIQKDLDSANDESSGSIKQNQHNTIFYGKNKVVIRTIVENKQKNFFYGDQKNKLRATKVKNNIIKKNLIGQNENKGIQKLGLTGEESFKILERLKEEEIKIRSLSKQNPSNSFTLVKNKKIKKDYLMNNVNLNNKKNKRFEEDSSNIKPKQHISGIKIKPFSTTLIRKSIQKMEEKEEKIPFEIISNSSKNINSLSSLRKISSKSFMKQDENETIKISANKPLLNFGDSEESFTEDEEIEEEYKLTKNYDFKLNKPVEGETEEIVEETEYNTEDEIKTCFKNSIISKKSKCILEQNIETFINDDEINSTEISEDPKNIVNVPQEEFKENSNSKKNFKKLKKIEFVHEINASDDDEIDADGNIII